MKLKAQCLPVVILLLTLAGCKKKNKKAVEVTPKKNKIASLAIPLAQDTVVVGEDESVRSFFDNDANQLVAQDGQDQKTELIPNDAKDFAPANVAQDRSFETLYFEFDKHAISKDQEPLVAKNAATAKKIIAEAAAKGQDVKLNLEGHADTFAGSKAYNVSLSEKRAVAEKNALIAQGVPAESISVVGRGNEVPAIVDGKPVTGDKDQQWLNRRVEAHVIYN